MTDHPGHQLQPRRRPLSSAERRLLLARAGMIRRRTGVYRRTLYLGAGVVALLWVLTLLASDSSWWVITAFWIVAGIVLLLWLHHSGRSEKRYVESLVTQLDSAVARNEADVYDFRARAYVELEEIEDEGACYAFDLGNRQIAFVIGQRFYPLQRFPGLDFSLVYPLDEHGQTVDMMIEKRGAAVAPTRVITSAVKRGLDIPQHLDVVVGDLNELEAILGSGRSDG